MLKFSQEYLMIPAEQYHRLQSNIVDKKEDSSHVTGTGEIENSSMDKEEHNSSDMSTLPAKDHTSKDIDSHEEDKDVSTDLHQYNETYRLGVLDENRILLAIPQRYRGRAGRLLKMIKHDISWNGKGELVKDGDVVHGSHISDLLRDLFVPYKHEIKGRSLFTQMLEDMNLPICLSIPSRKNNEPSDTLIKQSQVKLENKKEKKIRDKSKAKDPPSKTWLTF